MNVTITRQVVKRCPYRDEYDVGTLTITFTTDDAVPELHGLAHTIDLLDEPMTHEEYTLVISRITDAGVRTEWGTGPWAVICEVPIDPE